MTKQRAQLAASGPMSEAETETEIYRTSSPETAGKTGCPTNRIAQKRGQTALSTGEALSEVDGLWVGDRVVSPLF